MNYAPFIRIVLRYVVGAGITGSAALGDQLAADPDVIMAVSAGIGLMVELWYRFAKTHGGST